MPFPVVIRATFGIYGSLWPVFSRSVLDLVWYGIQTTFGGTFLDVCFICIFGDSWANIPNSLPASASITTRAMAAFFLYWLIQFFTNFFRPHEMKWMYCKYNSRFAMPGNGNTKKKKIFATQILTGDRDFRRQGYFHAYQPVRYLHLGHGPFRRPW